MMRCAFHQAVRWDMIGKNPFDDAILPKREKAVREIWTADIIRQALDSCSDGKLYIAINLAFACSLHMGEITGLTWNYSVDSKNSCPHFTGLEREAGQAERVYGTGLY